MSTYRENPPDRTAPATSAPAVENTDIRADQPPSRRSLVAATGASALAAGFVGGTATPASASAFAPAPSVAPAAAPAAPPPTVDRDTYLTVARAITVHDEHDRPLVPRYVKASD